MKKFFFVFLLSFVLLFPASTFALNEWTFICYLVGDDNKSASMVDSHVEALNRMASVGSRKPEYEVLVQFDRPKDSAGIFRWLNLGHNDKSGAIRCTFEQGKWNVVEKLGEVNMGSPYTLWNCLKWATKISPAKRYFLIIGGHGSGIFSWRGAGAVSSNKPGAVEFDPSKFVAYDDTDNDCLTLFELAAVFSAFKERLNNGRKLDLVAFDSCMPGAIETLYQLRDLCEVIAGSPSTSLIGGMNYKAIVQTISKNPKISAESLGQEVAKTYLESVSRWGTSGEIMGVWRTSKVQELAFSISNFAIEMITGVKEKGKFKIPNLTMYGGKNRYWDIGRITKSIFNGNVDLSGLSNGSILKQLAGEILEEAKACTVTVWYSGSFLADKVGGLSIAWPDEKEYREWQAFYKALDFSQATKWDEMLDLWVLGQK
ncbi:hypothetical protein HYY75_11960 [bacterium]|nr:hypothetical protein [bacterium]